jgi:integrase
MKGSVRKRGSTWSYYFDLGKVEGKRKKIERGGFKTKGEAQAALTAAMAEYNAAGQVFTPSEVTVSDYLDLWLDQYARMQLRFNTQMGYIDIVNNHLKPTIGKYKLKSLNTATIQAMINQKKIDGLAQKTVKGILSCLSVAMTYAVDVLQYIPANPCDRVKIPPYEGKTETRYIITPEQFRAILDRFQGTVFALPLMVGYYTGMRLNEVFALTWDRIDLEKGTITVDRQTIKRNFGVDVRKAAHRGDGMKEERSTWYLQPPKTMSSVRVIKIGPTLLTFLKQERQKQLQNSLKYGEYFMCHYAKPEKDEKGNTIIRIIDVERGVEVNLSRLDLVNIREDGSTVSSDSFKYCARIIHHELHMKFNFHSLRHTHATLLIESGANPKDVAVRLGHADTRTTFDIYTHTTEKMQEQTVDLFEQIASGH